MTRKRLQQRRNLAEEATESWRPPLMTTPARGWRGATAALRRSFDLQAGSIWADLKGLLSHAAGTVLDVGCGAQPYRCLLPAEAKYVGIDTVDAKDRFGYVVPDAEYYSGTAWPVDDGSVDMVLATETLEHVLEPSAFLAEAHRCLRVGGRLLMTVPFAARWHFIPYDYWRFTPSSLKHLLQAAGFDDIAVYARGNAVTVASYKAMALLLPLLFPQGCGRTQAWLRRAAGVCTAPVVLLLAIIGNASMRGRGGNDCLGYTVLARRGPTAPAPSGSRTNLTTIADA